MRELEREDPTPSAIAHHAALPALAVVGAGRVGGSIAAAAERAGLAATLAGRDQLGPIADAEAVLLCVPDQAITEAAAELVARGAAPRFAGHASGASTLDVLGPLVAAGAVPFSLHPLQTVPDRSTDFTGCPAAIAGSTPRPWSSPGH